MFGYRGKIRHVPKFGKLNRSRPLEFHKRTSTRKNRDRLAVVVWVYPEYNLRNFRAFTRHPVVFLNVVDFYLRRGMHSRIWGIKGRYSVAHGNIDPLSKYGLSKWG